MMKLSIKALILGVMVFSGLSVVNTQQALAASTNNFDAGRIIDDQVMTDDTSMSISQIQSFLNSKMPSCDTNGSKMYNSSQTRKQYAQSRGVSTPFKCLKDYSQGGKSAARIIYEKGKKYDINPQVLIVLLQKEQGLVTDDWPWPIQYRSATGYGCPDTAPCDSQYYGLSNQLDWAAKMFRSIIDRDPNWYSPYIAGNNPKVYWHPNTSSCSGKSLTIDNWSTAGLYSYTPYRPNQAALDAGYGEGNSCSSYGNRNFYLYFNDWFGSTNPGYSFNFERMEGESPALFSKQNPSLGSYTETLTRGDNIYTFYYDSTDKSLRYAFWNGSKWKNWTLDGVGSKYSRSVNNDVGKGITATFYKNELQLYYYDATTGSLRHAWTSDGQWRFETLDGTNGSITKNPQNVGRYPDVISYNGQLQLFYYNATTQSVRHTWWTGSKWKFETLDGTAQSVSGRTANVGASQNITAMKYGSKGIQMFYYDATTKSLRHTWWTGSKWKFETLDGTAQSVSGRTANVGKNPTVTTWNGSIQLFYYDETNGSLRHAWISKGSPSWRFETLDGASYSVLGNDGNIGSNSVVTQLDGKLSVFYFDRDNRSWKHAYFNKGWFGLTVDGELASQSGKDQSVGGQLTVKPFRGNGLQMFYKDESGSLVHSWAR